MRDSTHHHRPRNLRLGRKAYRKTVKLFAQCQRWTREKVLEPPFKPLGGFSLQAFLVVVQLIGAIVFVVGCCGECFH